MSVPRTLPVPMAAGIVGGCATALLVLTHLRPWHDHSRLLDEAAAIANCPVILARPGRRLAFPSNSDSRT